MIATLTGEIKKVIASNILAEKDVRGNLQNQEVWYCDGWVLLSGWNTFVDGTAKYCELGWYNCTTWEFERKLKSYEKEYIALLDKKIYGC